MTSVKNKVTAFGISIATHALLLGGLLTLWKAPSMPNPTNPSPALIVTLLPAMQNSPRIENSSLAPSAASPHKKSRLNQPNQAASIEPNLNAISAPALESNPAPSPSTREQKPNWSLSPEAAKNALRNKSLAEQSQEQVGSKHIGKHEKLAQNIEQSAKTNCLSDRGMGLFNLIFIANDVARDKCKLD